MKNLQQHIKALLIVTLLCAFVIPHSLRAQTTQSSGTVQTEANSQYTLLEPLPCLPGASGTSNSDCSSGLVHHISLTTYLQYAFNLLIAVSAVAAVVMIVWGGFQYILSASALVKQDGRERVTNAVIGLLMVLCTYIILHTVNPRLTNIPTTIVPPIQGLPKAVKTQSLYDIINGQVQKLQYVNTNQLQNDIHASQNKVGDLNKQYTAAQKQYSDAVAAGNVADEYKYQAQMNSIVDQSNTEIANIDLETYQVSFQNTITAATMSTTTTQAQYDGYLQQLDQQFDEADNEFQNSPAQHQTLQDGYYFSKALIIMAKDAAAAGNTTGSALKASVASYIGHAASFLGPVGQMVNSAANATVITEVFKTAYGNQQEKNLANNINNDVIIPIIPEIKDPVLKAQLTNAANSVVQTIH